MKFMHKLQNVDNFDEIIKTSLNKNFIHCLIDDLANEESMFTWEKRIQILQRMLVDTIIQDKFDIAY